MIKFILVLVCLICGTNLNQLCGQDYIITANNTRTEGIINEQNNYKYKLSFKSPSEDIYTQYTSSEIIEFSKQDQLYKSFEKEDGTKEFFRLLSKGAITLYVGTHKRELTEFIAVKNNDQFILRRSEELIGIKVIPNNEYVLHLKKLVIDDHETFKQVDKIRFIEPELKELIDNYNKSKGEYVQLSQLKKLHISKKIYFNIAYPGFKNSAEIRGEEAESKLNFGGGLLVDISHHNGLGFQTGLNFINYTNDVQAGEVTFFKDFVETHGILLNIPINFKYTLKNKRLKPNVFAGLSYGILFKKGFNLQRIPTSQQLDQETIFIPLDSNVDLGISGGFGLVIKENISIDFSIYSHLYLVLGKNLTTQQFRASPVSISLGYIF